MVEKDSDTDAIKCEVGVVRMDYLGREYSGDSLEHTHEKRLDYLKLINVPTMFDFGAPEADPQTESLSLCMLDSTSHKIIKQQFLGKEAGLEIGEIDKTRKTLQALHSNMQVSQININFKEPLAMSGTKNPAQLFIDGISIQSHIKHQNL